MAITKYTGVSSGRVFGGAAHDRVALSGGVGQGNGGTTLACAGCLVQPLLGNTAVVRVNVGAAASATVGIDLPFTSATVQCAPTYLLVDDASKLYFYSSDADAVVDLLAMG